MDFAYLLTSFDGRIPRKSYWMGGLVLVGVAIVLTVLLATILDFQSRTFLIASFILQLALLYPSAALMAKRLHDRGRPTYWMLFLLVPLVLQGLLAALGVIGDPVNPSAIDFLLNLIIFAVGIWFFIELGCLRGTVGPNEHGPDPLEAYA